MMLRNFLCGLVVAIAAFAAVAQIGEQVERNLGGVARSFTEIVNTLGEISKQISPESHAQLLENRELLAKSLRNVARGQLARLEKLVLDMPADELLAQALSSTELPFVEEMYNQSLGDARLARGRGVGLDGSDLMKPSVLGPGGASGGSSAKRISYSRLDVYRMLKMIGGEFNSSAETFLLSLEQYGTVPARARVAQVNKIANNRAQLLLVMGKLNIFIAGVEKMATYEHQR